MDKGNSAGKKESDQSIKETLQEEEQQQRIGRKKSEGMGKWVKEKPKVYGRGYCLSLEL